MRSAKNNLNLERNFYVTSPKKYFLYHQSTDLIRMSRRLLYYFIIIAAGLLFGLYFYITQINRPTFALEVDPTKDTTDISGIMYRIRVTNVGSDQLSGIVVDLGGTDILEFNIALPWTVIFFLSRT
jgi:hypothetical protein